MPNVPSLQVGRAHRLRRPRSPRRVGGTRVGDPSRMASSKAPFGNSARPHRPADPVDMISDFDFTDGKAVLRAARRIAPRIVALKARAAKARIPTIYVNDNSAAGVLGREEARSARPMRERP